jgi:hypothetical protein
MLLSLFDMAEDFGLGSGEWQVDVVKKTDFILRRKGYN